MWGQNLSDLVHTNYTNKSEVSKPTAGHTQVQLIFHVLNSAQETHSKVQMPGTWPSYKWNQSTSELLRQFCLTHYYGQLWVLDASINHHFAMTMKGNQRSVFALLSILTIYSYIKWFLIYNKFIWHSMRQNLWLVSCLHLLLIKALDIEILCLMMYFLYCFK